MRPSLYKCICLLGLLTIGCDNQNPSDAITKLNNPNHYQANTEVANLDYIYSQFLQDSMAIRLLKWSKCINLVKLTDPFEADFQMVYPHLDTASEKILSGQLIEFKEHQKLVLEQHIANVSQTTSLSESCKHIEQQYLSNYQHSKAEFIQYISNSSDK